MESPASAAPYRPDTRDDHLRAVAVLQKGHEIGQRRRRRARRGVRCARSGRRGRRARRPPGAVPPVAAVWATRSGLPSAEWPVLQRCAGSGASASRRRLNQSRATPATSSGRPAGRAGASGREASRALTPKAANGDPRAVRAGQSRRVAGTRCAAARVPRPAPSRRAMRSRRAACAHARRGATSVSDSGRGDCGIAREQFVGGDVERVREALQLVSREAPTAGLDAAHGGLVDADPPGEGALAPALPLAQARDLRADRSPDVRRASFPSPPSSYTVHHCYVVVCPLSCFGALDADLRDDVIIAS